MSYPKISLVTPSYNQGQFLEQTLDSVLSQGYPNLEYFVVDGGSSDNSREIIEKYSKHIDWWVSEKDNGQSHAINKGLRRATGDIVNWINSDDYYEPKALFTVAEKFIETNASMVSFRANVFGMQNRISRGTDIFEGNLPKSLAYTRIDQPETFFSKEAFQKMGLLNERLHYCMDKEWLLRYLLIEGQESAINSDEIILNFRYHEDSKSVSQNDKFEKEADAIYLHYAIHLGLNSEADLLKDLGAAVDENLKLDYPGGPLLSEHGAAMIHYYLFKRYKEEYEKLNRKKAFLIASGLNVNDLSQADRQEFTKLNQRLKQLPSFLIRWGRRMTR
jgi:glycosyltransferase involved in cell wall biosynthesis